MLGRVTVLVERCQYLMMDKYVKFHAYWLRDNIVTEMLKFYINKLIRQKRAITLSEELQYLF